MENVTRWYILDTCVREVMPNFMGLDDLKPEDMLTKKLQRDFIIRVTDAPRGL
jgi:hypothetical protein